MTNDCQFCGRPIQWSEDESVCLGDHPDRKESHVLLHIHCPCPVHTFNADRHYNVKTYRDYTDDEQQSSETNGADDKEATIEELVDEIIEENPGLAPGDDK